MAAHAACGSSCAKATGTKVKAISTEAIVVPICARIMCSLILVARPALRAPSVDTSARAVNWHLRHLRILPDEYAGAQCPAQIARESQRCDVATDGDG